jgi:indole-3-glycerol phosphate synthase
MNDQSILDRIFETKRLRVSEASLRREGSGLRADAESFRAERKPNLFRAAVSRDDRMSIIAEIKRASPSKGMINGSADIELVARQYDAGGAAAISVLTEEDFFAGSLGDLNKVRKATSLPILRKDFIFDEYQIWEAAVAGADAILLIAAMLEDSEIERLSSEAGRLGMDALVEVHSST